MGILVCNECNRTLEIRSHFFSRYNKFNKYYTFNVMKREKFGELFISNEGYAICKFDYNKLANSLISNPKQFKEDIFLAIDGVEIGYEGRNAPKYARKYQFLDFETARGFIPLTTKYLEIGKFDFVNLKELQERNSQFMKKLNGEL